MASPKQVEAYCRYCGNKFTYVQKMYSNGEINYYKIRYCSRSHAQYGAWRNSKRASQGRFQIDLQTLSFLYIDSDLSIPDIATKYGVNPVTVYRRVKEFGLSKTQGARRIFAPIDKTAIMITVPLELSDSIEAAIKEVIRQYHGVRLKVYNGTYRHPEIASVLAK